jgi:thiamine-phosphate pyrophosphorylase
VDAGHGAIVVVKDGRYLGLAGRAAGVHLRSDSADAVTVRSAAPPGFLIGRSVHGVDEAVSAARHSAPDYLIFGTTFETASKPAGHPAAGVDPLVQICAAVPVPVLAIGGITLDRAPQVARTGAAGVAAIGLFLPPEGVPAERHLAETVKALRRVFDTCGAAP